MPTLFIPTRNRAHSLGNVLSYMQRFYPDVNIAIADGSNSDCIKDVENVVNSYSQILPIDYQHYDPIIHLNKRTILALEKINDEFIVFGADDDYPIMELFAQGEAFLIENPTYSTAMGLRLKIKTSLTDGVQLKMATVRCVEADNCETRMRLFSKWSFATTNAVTRKKHAIRRCEDMQRFIFNNDAELDNFIGFLDYLIGNYDAAHGKIKAFSDVGYISGYHYKHDRFRNIDKLFYLKMPEQIVAMQKLLIYLAQEYGDAPYQDAHKLSVKLLRMRAAELSGAGFRKSSQFENSKEFNHPVVQEQHGLVDSSFELLRTNLSPEIQEKLDYATAALTIE